MSGPRPPHHPPPRNERFFRRDRSRSREADYRKVSSMLCRMVRYEENRPEGRDICRFWSFPVNTAETWLRQAWRWMQMAASASTSWWRRRACVKGPCSARFGPLGLLLAPFRALKAMSKASDSLRKGRFKWRARNINIKIDITEPCATPWSPRRMVWT